MITVFGSNVGEREIELVNESMRSQWMGMGPKVKSFESKLSQRLKLPGLLMLDSGSNALYMAVRLLELPPNSEVIVPSYTWVSCAQAVLLAGHKPVFCDVELDSMNVSLDTVKAQITDKTAAIMVVHYAGLPVEIDDIMALGYPVIEDAAHAIDSYSKGRACGGIGDVGIYSFDAVKNLAVGEGGGITASNERMLEKARSLRYCGIEKSGFDASVNGKSRWWEYQISDAFIKMNPSDISAGIGLGQLERLDELQHTRKEIWNFYQSVFEGIDEVTTPIEAEPGDKHSYFTYSIRVKSRDQLAEYLMKNDIYSTLRYHPLHLNEIYKQTDKSLPACEQLNKEALSIPLHPSMTMEDASTVVEFVQKYIREMHIQKKRNRPAQLGEMV